VRQPEVFLFDEPLSNLDAKMRVQMRTEITKLHQRLQATMIYVTHDQIEAMTMGTRIVVMKDGVTQQVDSPLAIYREPKTFRGRLSRNSPMNLVSGTLHMRNGVAQEARGSAIEVELGDRRDAWVMSARSVWASVGVRSVFVRANSSNNCFRPW
jgi:multiple sugar transport system ATP-binding protein